jgi:hypothetical protein
MVIPLSSIIPLSPTSDWSSDQEEEKKSSDFFDMKPPRSSA